MRFTKLHATIVASSIWAESPQTCKVWITMLALADWDGMVSASVDGLAHLARVSIEECQTALAKLAGPDPYSRDGTSGERIEKVVGGWIILNHNRYRDMRSPKQLRDAAYMREYRSRPNNAYSKECKSYTSISSSENSKSSRKEGSITKPKKPKPSVDMALFERFWEAYQKKVGKVQASRVWASKIGADTDLAERVIAAAQQFADLPDTKKDARKWQPHPSTWLHGEKWNDEIPGVTPLKSGPPKMDDDLYAEAVQEYLSANAETRAEIRNGHAASLDHANLRDFDRQWIETFLEFVSEIDREEGR